MRKLLELVLPTAGMTCSSLTFVWSSPRRFEPVRAKRTHVPGLPARSLKSARGATYWVKRGHLQVSP